MKNIVFNKKKSNSILDYFVENGFCVVRGIYNEKKLKELEKFFKIISLKFEKINKRNFYDQQAFAIACGSIFNKSDLNDYFFNNKNLIQLLKLFYGNDIIKIGESRFQINTKIRNNKKQIEDEKKHSQYLGIHSDYWTGTSEYSIHYWLPFFGLDKKNSMTVYPGSHLNGPFPVYNRSIDKSYKFLYKPHNLNFLKKGDLVLFHSLLLHKTSGKSQKTRASLLTRFNNLHYRKTQQEYDLGFKTLSAGPMRKIIRMIGNDRLTPFRTYGGKAGIDRVTKSIYAENQMQPKDLSLIDKLKK